MDWVGIGAEFLVAVGTLVLAYATFRMVAEVREARLEERREKPRTAMRAALIEQTDTSRIWLEAHPMRDSHLSRRLAKSESVPPMVALSHVLEQVQMPNDLVAYLVWLRDRAARVQRLYRLAMRRNDEQRVRDLREAEIDHLQTIVCLLEAHARATPDLEPAAAAAGLLEWREARMWPEGQRQGQQRELEARGQAPPFPTGPAYAPCSPTSRDAEGTAAGPVRPA